MSADGAVMPAKPIDRDIIDKIGPPPEPTIVETNPKWLEWVERYALRLCDKAGELGEIPTPCSAHLNEARGAGYEFRTTINA